MQRAPDPFHQQQAVQCVIYRPVRVPSLMSVCVKVLVCPILSSNAVCFDRQEISPARFHTSQAHQGGEMRSRRLSRWAACANSHRPPSAPTQPRRPRVSRNATAPRGRSRRRATHSGKSSYRHVRELQGEFTDGAIHRGGEGKKVQRRDMTEHFVARNEPNRGACMPKTLYV